MLSQYDAQIMEVWTVADQPRCIDETNFVRLISTEEGCQTGGNVLADTGVDSASGPNESQISQ